RKHALGRPTHTSPGGVRSTPCPPAAGRRRGFAAALWPVLSRRRGRLRLGNFHPARPAGSRRRRVVGEEKEQEADDQRDRRQGADAERDPHSPAAAGLKKLGAFVVAGPRADDGLLRLIELGLGLSLRLLRLLRRQDVRRRLLSGSWRAFGGRPRGGAAEKLRAAPGVDRGQ